MTPSDPGSAIEALRQRLGQELTIVGHHYQSEAIVRHCDFRGDSLELARQVEAIASPHIIFCGVHFMGESAALLARSGQLVHLPNPEAQCNMALMSPAKLVDRVMLRLTAKGRKVIPLAYVNTSLGVKAVVGRYGGAVCTSANASRMLQWALEQGDGVLFLPDRNLARNTARVLGLSETKWHTLDIRRQGQAVDTEAADRAELLIWPGLCAIHARFVPEQIELARRSHPGCVVVVHPECSPEVVSAADVAGSTSTIIQVAREAASGAVVYVGTEINLVRRLERELQGRVMVKPLAVSACGHMGKVTPTKLLHTVEAIATGRAEAVGVEPKDAAPAKASLERMLRACVSA